MNDSADEGGQITSLTVGELVGSATGQSKEPVVTTFEDEEQEMDRIFSQNIQKSSNEVDIELSFDKIPEVRKEARIKEMELTFDDLDTKISVNKDKLELSNLQQVSLRISGFVGEIHFDERDFSLEGVARRLAVNDVTLSSREEIDISFDDLDYKSLTIDEIELSDLELENGDGEMKVAEKLQYSLEQDKLKIYEYNGQVLVDRDVEDVLTLEGVARGIAVSGALMNFNLR